MSRYLQFEQVYWLDRKLKDYTTIIVCELFYTFDSHITDSELHDVIDRITDRMGYWEVDGATTEISDDVKTVMFRKVHDTFIILN